MSDEVVTLPDVLIMPEEIDFAFYKQTLECVLQRQQRRLNGETVPPLRLFCRSNGGASDEAFAIVSAIRMDGNVQGIVLASTCSSGVTIWAACQERFITPFAKIGVHPVSWNGVEGVLDARRLNAASDDFTWIDRRQCEIYAAASDKDFEWWWERYHRNLYELFWLDSKEVIEIGMAKVWDGAQ